MSVSSKSRNEIASLEAKDLYHIRLFNCTTDDHRKNLNCRGKPLCIHGLGENSLHDVIGELKRVEEHAKSMVRDRNVPIGLVNALNTCYINVLLQSLFRVWPFRKLIMEFKTEDRSGIIWSIQKIFTEMELSKALVYYPQELITAMEIDPAIQCDAHEFFDKLLTALKEEAVSLYGEEVNKRFESIFTGVRYLCRNCMKCNEVFYTPDYFSFLDTYIINYPRLEDALQGLFTKEKMTGSEQYFCSKCQQKVNAEVLTMVKRLPPILMIRMQRLQFDRGSGNQMKLTNGVQIPLQLDFADFSNLDKSIHTSNYELVSVIHHLGEYTSSGHYICHIQSNGKWYVVNDNVVEEIGCPYVDCFLSPWRPIKQPNMAFSQQPIEYHDVTLKEGEHREEIEDEYVSSSANESDSEKGDHIMEENGAGFALPVHLSKPRSEKPKKSTKRREKKESKRPKMSNDEWKPVKTKPKRKKERISWKEIKSVLWEIDSKMTTITRSVKTTMKGMQSLRDTAALMKMDCEKMDECTKQYQEMSEEAKRVGADKNSVLQKVKKVENKRKALAREKRKRKRMEDSDEDQDEYRLLGGTMRSRRMVTNNSTVQSAYMCFYVRYDVVRRMRKEGEDTSMYDSVGNDVIETIRAANDVLSSMIEEEYKMTINLCALLEKRSQSYEECLSSSTELDEKTSVYVEKSILKDWIAGKDLIQPVYEEFLDRLNKEKESCADSVEGEATLPNEEVKGDAYETEQRQADNPIPQTRSLQRMDSEYVEEESTITEASNASKKVTLLEEIIGVLDTSLKRKDDKNLLNDKDIEIEEEDEKDEVNVCTHQRMHPIYFRNTYKRIPEGLIAFMKEALPDLKYYRYEDVYCEACSKEYQAYLERMEREHADLLGLSSVLNEANKKKNKMMMSKKNGEETKEAKETEEGVQYLVSTSFNKILKDMIIARKKVIVHPEKCTMRILEKCSAGLTNPTHTLLCNHHMLRHWLRQTDIIQLDADQWSMVKKCFPETEEVTNKVPICFDCRRHYNTASNDGREINDNSASEEREKSGVETPQEKIMIRIKRDLLQKGETEEPDKKQKMSTLSYLDVLEKKKRRVYKKEKPFPTKERLYQGVMNNRLNMGVLFVNNLSGDERKRLILEDEVLLKLVHRDSNTSLKYFDDSQTFNEGCYFFIRTQWLRRWREWLASSPTEPSDELYGKCQRLEYLSPCPHKKNAIPLYMKQFIEGRTQIPIASLTRPNQQVDIISETELTHLLCHHYMYSNPCGFFYGSVKEEEKAIHYFMRVCQECSIRESEEYDEILDHTIPIILVTVPQKMIPDLWTEQCLLLSGSCCSFTCNSIDDLKSLKKRVAQILGIEENAFLLMNRYGEIQSGLVIHTITPCSVLYYTMK